jgi:hypothetical protein
MFSTNTISVSDSRVSCASSHYLHVVHTCGARRRRVVRASFVLFRVSFVLFRVSRVSCVAHARRSRSVRVIKLCYL